MLEDVQKNDILILSEGTERRVIEASKVDENEVFVRYKTDKGGTMSLIFDVESGIAPGTSIKVVKVIKYV